MPRRESAVSILKEKQEVTDLLRFGFEPAEIKRYGIDDAAEEVAFGRSLGAAIVTGHASMHLYNEDCI